MRFAEMSSVHKMVHCYFDIDMKSAKLGEIELSV